MRKFDPTQEDSIRRWPKVLARLFNHMIQWTDEYCICGYPVTGSFVFEIDQIESVPVVVPICSYKTDCGRMIRETMEKGIYAEMRPSMVTATVEALAAGERPLSLRLF